jgi:ribulose-phosphate 3-epimerase
MKIPKISYSLLASLNKEKNISNALFSISNIGIDMIHYDISENEYTLNVKDLKKCTFLPFDIHISTKDPISQLQNVSLEPTDRVTIHVECNYTIDEISKFKNKLNCKIGLALNIETPIEQLFPYLEYVDYVLFMTVIPGISGMSFDESVFEKIKSFRKKYPEYSITIDGGINDKTAMLTRPFMPDVLVSGSFILKEKNYKKQVFKLIGQDLNL